MITVCLEYFTVTR